MCAPTGHFAPKNFVNCFLLHKPGRSNRHVLWHLLPGWNQMLRPQKDLLVSYSLAACGKSQEGLTPNGGHGKVGGCQLTDAPFESAETVGP